MRHPNAVPYHESDKGLQLNGRRPATKAEKLKALQDRADRLKAQIADLEAQNAARQRKEDTRAKVLIGAGIIADLEHHAENLALVRTILARAITQPRDREFLRTRGLID